MISVQQANGQYASGTYGSLSVNVGPSPLQTLALALPASSINRGVFPSPSTVTLKDIYGNPVPVRPVTITTSLPGSITIAGSGGDHVLDEPDDFNPSTGVADLSATGLAMRYTGLAGHGIFTATTANPLGGMLVATDIV